MRAIVVVVIFELVEFSIQIDSIPERNVLEVLFPDCTNDPLNKGVGHWYIGYRLDFVYFLTSQVRLPAMIFEQRIIVGAQGHGRTGARDRLIEHFAHSDCIDISSMNAEADDASTPLVDDYQHPV